MRSLGLDVRTSAWTGTRRDAHAKPRMRRRGCIEPAERVQHLVSRSLQHVDAEVYRSARGEPCPLLSCFRTESAFQQRVEPLRIVAADVSGGLRRDLALEAGKLVRRKGSW